MSCRIDALTGYGAWVSVEGVGYAGLLLLPDVSWGRVRRPGDALQVGDVHDMMVLLHEPAEERLRVGLKQLAPDPWSRSVRLCLGERLSAPVVSVAEFGVFVALEPHVEALLHADALGGLRPRVGDWLSVVVVQLDHVARRARVVLAGPTGGGR